MFDFFEKILGFVQTLFNFVLNIINSLIMALQMVVSVVTVPTFISTFLPPVLCSAVLIFTAIYVVKFIIGR